MKESLLENFRALKLCSRSVDVSS